MKLVKKRKPIKVDEAMTIEKVKDKIKKLLKLSESPNENEAKLAVKKAQRLMAAYKLQMGDIEEKEDKVIERVFMDNYCTPYKNAYRIVLRDTIAEFYCCVGYSVKMDSNSTKLYTALRGFENDVEICESVIKFADSYINDWFKEYKGTVGHLFGMSSQRLNADKTQYGIGFANGLKELLEEQMNSINQEWGLVMVAPKEAQDFLNSCSRKQLGINQSANQKIYDDGFNAGRKAEINKTLKA